MLIHHASNSASYLNLHNLLPLLSSCQHLRTLTQIHALLITAALSSDASSKTHLINKYASFQRCNLSRQIFDSSPNPPLILCNSMIRAYGRTNHHREALQLYRSMSGTQPDKFTFTFALKACTGVLDADEGRRIHGEIVGRKLENDVFIATGLVDMYCKVGDLGCAREVFDKMPSRDIVAWNAMVSGLSQSGDPGEALELFKEMQLGRGVEPNAVTLLNLFPAVCKLNDLRACRSIHGYVWRRDFPTSVLNGMIDVYAKCGCSEVARFIFDGMIRRSDDVTWGTMMAGYVYNGKFLEVLELFDSLRGRNLMINMVSALNALMAASELKDLRTGVEIHDCVVRQKKFEPDVRFTTSLITMYAKCGEVERAGSIFWSMTDKDLVAWSAVISAFAQSGNYEDALCVFREMQNEKQKPNVVTLVSVLPACAELLAADLGKSLHCYAVKDGVDHDISVGTALVSMYAKCTLFSSALILFERLHSKEVVTWNGLISAYAQVGDAHNALQMFNRLRMSDLCPDPGTIVGVLPACALLGDVNLGTKVHGHVIKLGFESDYHVKNALMDMYAKCRSLSSAEFLFKELEFAKDEVSWNTMIAGYTINGCSKDAISAFQRMKSDNFQPSLVTIVTILPAITFLTALKEGMAIHSYIIQRGFHTKTLAGNALIVMYAKCGRLDDSKQIFAEMKSKDIVSWNSMIAAYSVHGLGDSALAIFSTMQENEIKMDSVSFTSVLSACRHAGLIEEGKKIFNSMKQKHSLEPGLEHYACMVDLLGRAGLFDEILRLIKGMPMQPDAAVWGALLDACRMHANVTLGELALEKIAELEEGNMGHYVVLSGLYSGNGRWDDAGSTRLRMEQTGLRKIPGCSWL